MLKRSMVRIIRCLISFTVIFTLLGNVTYAYSLDDVKQDYKRFKIKKHSAINDAGQRVNWREGQIMKLPSSSLGISNMLRFYLFEYESGTKFVEIKLYYASDGWALWDRLTLGNGKTSYDVFPFGSPQRGMVSSWRVGETLTFIILTRNDFSKWKDAIQIRGKGARYYDDYVINPNEYKVVMKVIERFLFE